MQCWLASARHATIMRLCLVARAKPVSTPTTASGLALARAGLRFRDLCTGMAAVQPRLEMCADAAQQPSAKYGLDQTLLDP